MPPTNCPLDPLATKSVGSWCKPEWLFSGTPTHCNNDKDKKIASSEKSKTWKTGWVTDDPDELAVRKEQGTVWALKEQISAGLEVVSDGEQKRESYIHYHLRHLNGIDFSVLTEKSYRGGTITGGLPTFTSPVTTKQLYAAGDFEFSKGVAMSMGRSPSCITISLPGPMTIWDTTANTYYESNEKLAMALAATVRDEVASLIAAGCKHIMIDEPVWVRYPDEVKEWGVKALEACFKGLPGREKVSIMTHVCCSYPTKSVKSGGRADPKVYEILGPLVAASDLDGISIEHTIRPLDLTVLKKYAPKKVMLGVVGIDPVDKTETVAEIEERIEGALKFIEPERLILSPDCGCVLLSPAQARTKMANMVKAGENVKKKRGIVCEPCHDLPDFDEPLLKKRQCMAW